MLVYHLMLLHIINYNPQIAFSLLFSLLANVAKKTNLQKILAPRLLLQDDELVEVHLH
jgi:hypothetical protein